MLHETISLLFFSAKSLIAVMMLLILLAGILMLLGRRRHSTSGTLQVKDLNDRYTELKDTLLVKILPKAQFKTLQKSQKQSKKQIEKSEEKQPTVFLIRFNGDIRASAVEALREEITAILGVADTHDEVVLQLESAGGVVHGYGLAASQLQRLRDRHIRLTIIVDKVAASGGYMMACMANHLIAAPFAIIGSIGVILQLPNFNRLLKEQHIDFEQVTAGRYKRTLTVFGENTEESRQKSREEIEAIHRLFRDLVERYRTKADMDRVTTGEHWTGTQALPLSLIDAIGTSDDYLLQCAKTKRLLEVRWLTPRSLVEKLTSSGTRLLSFMQRASLPW